MCKYTWYIAESESEGLSPEGGNNSTGISKYHGKKNGKGKVKLTETYNDSYYIDTEGVYKYVTTSVVKITNTCDLNGTYFANYKYAQGADNVSNIYISSSEPSKQIKVTFKKDFAKVIVESI